MSIFANVGLNEYFASPKISCVFGVYLAITTHQKCLAIFV